MTQTTTQHFIHNPNSNTYNALMEDSTQCNEMPEVVTLYRGTSSEDLFNFSHPHSAWTTDEVLARNYSKGLVLKGVFKKGQILGSDGTTYIINISKMKETMLSNYTYHSK